MEETFGERLRILRKRRGMTQVDLAQALGVTVQTIVRYESLQQSNLRPQRLQALAAALDVEERDLVLDEGDRTEQDIQLMNRGLRNMDPTSRENLLRIILPLIEQYQRREGARDDEAPAP